MNPSHPEPHADTPLRRIAIHVEEVRAGRYRWVLSEVSDTADAPWTAIERASRATPTYREAMAQGLLQLQGMVDDLDAGPRRTLPSDDAQIEDAPQDGGEDAVDGDAPAAAPRKDPRTAFGFGRVG